MELDWMKLLESIVLTVVNYGSGAIPVFVLTWLIDRVLKVAPWLAPYRELVKQFVLGKIEQIKLERTKAVVIAGEQVYRSSQNDLASTGSPVSALQKETLQDTRNRMVLEAVSDRRISKVSADSVLLIEQAVNDLKGEGRL
jgi:hypothetical protein